MGRGRRDKVLLTIEQRQRLEKISRNGYAPAYENSARQSSVDV